MDDNMDVKEVRNERVAADTAATKVVAPEQATPSREISNTTDDTVSVNSQIREGVAHQNQIRSQINNVINVVNVATEATNEIEKLVHSISGIVEQADSESIPANRKQALETEARDLADAIKQTLKTEAPGGVKPLAGDKIRFEVEEKFRKTLDIVLPDNSKDDLGLSLIRFSPKEAIIQTKVNIETAKKRIDELKQVLDVTRKSVLSTADEIDVANQNAASAATTVRDLDQAFALADSTHTKINSEPEKAIGSLGQMKDRALTLLE